MKTATSGDGEKDLGIEKPSGLRPNKSRVRERKLSLQPSFTPPGWTPCCNAAAGSAVQMYINIGAF